MLPAINFKATEFYAYIGVVILIYIGMTILTTKVFAKPEYVPYVKKTVKIPIIIGIAFAVVFAVGYLVSAPLFRADDYNKLIDVKVERGKKETSVAEIELVSLTSKITNLITTLDFVQTEPVGAVVKETTYRIYFISENNEKISNENVYVADKKDSDAVKRVFRLKFSFKNKQYNKTSYHDHNNYTIRFNI